MACDNYARKDGKYRFFSGVPPFPVTADTAFYKIPEGRDPVQFIGALIGESPPQHCERLGHISLSGCQKCAAEEIAARLGKAPSYKINGGGKRTN